MSTPAIVRALVEAAFRESVIAGLSETGANPPAKTEIRAALGVALEAALVAASGNLRPFATVALMDADVSQADGALAYVYDNNGSASDPANGVYQWDDGATDWIVAPWYFATIAALAAPIAAGLVTPEALALIAAQPGFNAGYPNAYTDALPRGVMSGTVGGDAVTGATVGTWALTPTGGDIAGVEANLVVTSATAASIAIVNPGLGSGTTPPTWAKPAGATLPPGTTITAVVAPRIGEEGIYFALSADGQTLQGYRNDGTATPELVTGVAIPTAAVFTGFQPAASGDSITSTVTEGGGSVEYNRQGRLFIGKVMPHPASVEDVFYIQTTPPDTNDGVVTNDIFIFARTGHMENDYGLRSRFHLLDQRAATSAGSRRENSFTWSETSRVAFTSGDLFNAALVQQLIGTGVQGIILNEAIDGGGLSVDDGGTPYSVFIGTGHGGVFAVEDPQLMADGIAVDFTIHGRRPARHISFVTKERYYRNRAGAITVASPVALVENEFEFLSGSRMRLSSTVTFEQDLTGSLYGHATTVLTAAYTNLARYADQRRRFALDDYVGAGGADLEVVTRSNVHRVTYDDVASGELDIARTVCERYGPGTWPKASGRLDFALNEATLKVTDDRKTYFLLGGTVAGANHEFLSGEVLKIVTEYRFGAPWENSDAA